VPIARDRHPEGQRLSAENAKRVNLALIVFTAMWIAFSAAFVTRWASFDPHWSSLILAVGLFRPALVVRFN
jgi:hypothetical protein